ncbi:MAG: hypothetical protein ACOYK6_05430 [Chthoniobacterales bacterium]
MNISENIPAVSTNQDTIIDSARSHVPQHSTTGSIESVTPIQGAHQGIYHEKIGTPGVTSDTSSILNHTIADASEVTKSSPVDLRPEVKITGKDVLEALEYVTGQLAPFFQKIDEDNASKIFVFGKDTQDKKSIELHDNTISSDAGDMVVEASHEEAKEFFVNHLTVLYGKVVIDCFYPQEQRKEPLTLGQAHLLRGQLNEFQKSMESSCQGDPSKYDACLQSHLETLHQLQKSVATTFGSDAALKLQVDSLTDYLSKQLGVSSETVQASFVAGMAISSVAAVAATGGLGLPAALHVASTSAIGALSHGVGAGGLAAGMMGSAHLAGTSAVAAHTTTAAGIGRAAAGVAAATVVGGGIGAVIAAPLYNLYSALGLLTEFSGDETRMNAVRRDMIIIGAGQGAIIAFVAALMSPAALGVGIVAHPATWGLYGAIGSALMGSAGYGYLASGENPQEADEIEDLHPRLHSFLPGSETLPPTVQIALIATMAGGFAGGVIGASAYAVGGLASLAGHIAAAAAAAV